MLLDQNHDQTQASFLVTLSSGDSDATNTTDDTNCENDFVFLPAPPPPLPSMPPVTGAANNQQLEENNAKSIVPTTRSQQQYRPSTLQSSKRSEFKLPLEVASDATTYYNNNHFQSQTATHPLMAINSNGGNNPFFGLQQVGSENTGAITQQPIWTSKPVGLLEACSNIVENPSKLSDLIHQIVTRADSIYIAIPCAHCHEQIACLPTDISAWLNHMSMLHNCKVCPICNKMIGLGPVRDIEIMRKHVINHLDNEWLNHRASKVDFSFGLQKQWFLGGRCTIKNIRSMTHRY